jgi:hypothetical protein
VTLRAAARGLAALLLGAPLLALAQVAASASPAAPDPLADCSTTVGTIVAVDFAHWSKPIERGCAVQLTTEYAAMHAAGFRTTGDGTDGPAFVCRIDDEPPTSEQSCATTPPADAYWSFWYADAGQNAWAYSEQGAMDFEPQPGSVTFWIFGSTDTRPPASDPPSALRASNTSPTTTSTTPPPPTTTTSSTVTSTSAAGATSTTRPVTTSTVAETSSTTGTTSVPRSSSTTSPPAASTPTTTTTVPPGSGPVAIGTEPGTGPKIVDVGSSSGGAGDPGAGSPLPLVIGGILALALASAAVVVGRRRRRA